MQQHSTTIAITGPALRLLLAKESKLDYNFIRRCRVFGDMTESDKEKLVALFKESNPLEPVGLVFKNSAGQRLIKAVDVSIGIQVNTLQ